eukprot:scaffold257884_cov13-Tisochrysis_lutea.AAC.1
MPILERPIPPDRETSTMATHPQLRQERIIPETQHAQPKAQLGSLVRLEEVCARAHPSARLQEICVHKRIRGREN